MRWIAFSCIVFFTLSSVTAAQDSASPRQSQLLHRGEATASIDGTAYSFHLYHHSGFRMLEQPDAGIFPGFAVVLTSDDPAIEPEVFWTRYGHGIHTPRGEIRKRPVPVMVDEGMGPQPFIEQQFEWYSSGVEHIGTIWFDDRTKTLWLAIAGTADITTLYSVEALQIEPKPDGSGVTITEIRGWGEQLNHQGYRLLAAELNLMPSEDDSVIFEVVYEQRMIYKHKEPTRIPLNWRERKRPIEPSRIRETRERWFA